MSASSRNARFQELREQAVARLEALDAGDRAQLEAWQVECLDAQLAHCARNSPHYALLHRQGRLPDRVSTLDELADLPFTTKEDLRAAYPFGLLAAPREELIRYGESTGTTGAPTSAFITYADWIDGNVAVEAALGHVFGPGDLVFVAIPYELAFASYDIDRALEMVGAAVVAVGALSKVCPFERTAQMMRAAGATGLVCTPTRAARLHDLLSERGHDPRSVGLRTLLYVGETCSEAKLRKIADMWGIGLVSAYGSTETNSLALPCWLGASHLSEDRHVFEVVDPDSGQPLAPGQTGELVLTSLTARAMPLVRYRTGDLVRVMARPCPCGTPRRVLRHLGRVGESLEVGDSRLAKIAVEQAVLSAPGTGLWYAAGARGDALEVRVEAAPGTDEGTVAEEVRRQVEDAFGVRCRVAGLSRADANRAMDAMLKPGSLTLDDLEGVA